MPLIRIAFVLCSISTAAHAGMPSFDITDAAKLRLEVISFFLLGLCVCALLIQLLWNFLQKDFSRLPRLKYPKALGLTTLLGVLFLFVLTMISGARELMTPGAWKKDGATYSLVEEGRKPLTLDERKQHLESLRVALWDYSKAHNNAFPPHEFSPEIPERLWAPPYGERYIYLGTPAKNDSPLPLAYEPRSVGTERLVLLTSGEIVVMTTAEILKSQETR